MPAILIDLPDALLDCIDAIAAHDYGDRESVIRRLLARGVAAEMQEPQWLARTRRHFFDPAERPRAPDGPGDYAPIAPIGHPMGPPMTLPNRGTFANVMDPVAMVSRAMRDVIGDAHPVLAWSPPALSAEEEAQRLAHAARRLRERRIAQGLDPDTGCAPAPASIDARGSTDPGTSDDDA